MSNIIKPKEIKDNYEYYKNLVGFDIVTLFENEYGYSMAKRVIYKIVNEKTDKKEVEEFKCKNKNCEKPTTTQFCSRRCADEYRIGIKRPEHSKRLKKKYENGEINEGFLKQQGENAKNGFLNSKDFKIKRLENHGYEINDLKEHEIEEKYSELLQEIYTSRKYKENCMIRYWEKYKDNNLLSESVLKDYIYNLEDLSDDDIDYLYKIYNSVKSIIAMKNNPQMGARGGFVRDELGNFSFNYADQEKITTRSSWESYMIEFFEENGIWWSFENKMIPKENGTYYIPDFEVIFQNRKMILEVKGAFLFTSEDVFFKEKAKPAIDTVGNYYIIFRLPNSLKDFEQLLEESNSYINEKQKELLNGSN